MIWGSGQPRTLSLLSELTQGKHSGVLKVICPGKRLIFSSITTLQRTKRHPKWIPDDDPISKYVFVVPLTINV